MLLLPPVTVRTSPGDSAGQKVPVLAPGEHILAEGLWPTGRLSMGAWDSLATKKGKEMEGEAPPSQAWVRSVQSSGRGSGVGSQMLSLWSCDQKLQTAQWR